MIYSEAINDLHGSYTIIRST